jgi:hypothetical protein
MRRIRGAIGMGFTWGAAWSVAGFALAAMMRFKADAPFPIIFGVLGFLAGVIFSPRQQNLWAAGGSGSEPRVW